MIEKVFSTPLYSTISENNDIQNEIGACIDKVNFQYIEKWGKTHKISIVDAEDVIGHYELDHFKKFLNENIVEYCKQIGFQPKEKYRLQSWFAKFNKDDYGHIHNHGHADISGVYYYKTNGDDGDLAFYTPVINSETSTVFNVDTTWIHKPVVGKLIMFPGYLKHGIFRNTTTSERISLSFNIDFNKF